MLSRLGCSLRFNTPGYPEASGLTECFNQTCKNMLYHIVQQHGRQWHKFVPLMTWALREVPNAMTVVSPYMLVYGHVPCGPLAVLEGSLTGERDVTLDLMKVGLKDKLTNTEQVQDDDRPGAVNPVETTLEFKAKTMLDHHVPETVKPEPDVEIQVETLNLFSELHSPYANCNSRMLLQVLQQSDLCCTRTYTIFCVVILVWLPPDPPWLVVSGCVASTRPASVVSFVYLM